VNKPHFCLLSPDVEHVFFHFLFIFRKVAGSITDEVIFLIYLILPAALGLCFTELRSQCQTAVSRYCFFTPRETAPVSGPRAGLNAVD
jgi:hypothetical protein